PAPLAAKASSSSTKKSSAVVRIVAHSTAGPHARGRSTPLMRRPARSRRQAPSRTSRHTACAAMPSPRPVKPSFSLVVALTLTASTSTPVSLAISARIASACGPTLGRSQTTVMSALPSLQPRSRSRSLQWRTKLRLSAPFQRGSEGGKCRPMSPSASAPSIASHSACSTTSPSLCASTPRSCGTRTPPSMTWSPSPKTWTSKPWPMRMSTASGACVVAAAVLGLAVLGLDLGRRLVADRPQPLQRIELAHARQHHVDHHVAEVHQHPFGLALALDAERLHVELLREADHLVGDRLDVARRSARGDDHEIGDAALAAHVDLGDVAGLEFLDRGVDGLQQALDRRRRIGELRADDLGLAGQGRLPWLETVAIIPVGLRRPR